MRQTESEKIWLHTKLYIYIHIKNYQMKNSRL